MGKLPLKVKQEMLKKIQQGEDAGDGCQLQGEKQNEVLSRLEYMTEDKRRSTQEESQSLSGELPTIFTVEQILASKMHKARYQCKMNL